MGLPSLAQYSGFYGPPSFAIFRKCEVRSGKSSNIHIQYTLYNQFWMPESGPNDSRGQPESIEPNPVWSDIFCSDTSPSFILFVVLVLLRVKHSTAGVPYHAACMTHQQRAAAAAWPHNPACTPCSMHHQQLLKLLHGISGWQVDPKMYCQSIPYCYQDWMQKNQYFLYWPPARSETRFGSVWISCFRLCVWFSIIPKNHSVMVSFGLVAARVVLLYFQ